MMFRVLCFSVLLSIVSVPPSRADDSFEARYAIAVEHAKVWIELLPKGPEWVLKTSLNKTLDHLRARCGNVVDRRKQEVASILIDWVHATFQQMTASTARTLAEHFSEQDLRRFSFRDTDAPTLLETVGQKRVDRFMEQHRNRIDKLKREKWIILK